MNAQRVIRIAGTASLWIALGLGAYGGVALLLAYRNLPAGACPFDLQRPVFGAALAFAVLSLVLSYLEKRRDA